MRILLFTGKGGVGKTSVAAATALRCAHLGYRTVVLSTDVAHSLADSFDRPLGPEPTEVVPNLWGQELDVLYQMEKQWGNVQRYMAAVLSWRGLDELIAEELTVLPGMEELASLMQIVHLHDSGDYEAIIIDCAPTGATLQLLTLPEMARWYLRRIFPLERRAAQISRPILRAITDIPLPDDELFDTVEDLIGQLNRMKELLSDPATSSVRLVLNPEKMVIKEAQRTFTYLQLYGYATDLIISNRVMSQGIEGDYLASWRDIHQHYGQMIEEAFAPLPIRQVPFFEQEVVGLGMLHRVADAIYGSEDPTQVYYVGRTHETVRRDEYYELRFALPFVSKEQIILTRSGDELIIHIGNWKRNLILPRALVGLEVEGATYEGDVLVVRFEGGQSE